MRDIVIVDIDGTLSKIGDRLSCLARIPPDYDEFYDRCDEDEPMVEIIRMVKALSWYYQIILCTGRRESCRAKTKMWLVKYDLTESNMMLMRPNGNTWNDTELKPHLLEQEGITLDRIAFVIEDRDAMVKKWREMGLVCVQVADGNY